MLEPTMEPLPPRDPELDLEAPHRRAGTRDIDERCVRAVRIGHGANCSSIGSVIDTLFASAAIGAAVIAAIAAALKSEPVREVRNGGGTGVPRDEADEAPKDPS